MYNKNDRYCSYEKILVDILNKMDKEEIADAVVDHCPNPEKFLQRMFRDYGELTPKNCMDVALVLEDERTVISTFYSMSENYEEKKKIHIYLVLLMMCYVDDAGGVHSNNRAVRMKNKLHRWIEDYENRKYIISILKNVTDKAGLMRYWGCRDERRNAFIRALYSYEDTREYLIEEMKEHKSMFAEYFPEEERFKPEPLEIDANRPLSVRERMILLAKKNQN